MTAALLSLKSLASMTTCDLCDAFEDKLQYPIVANVKSFGKKERFFGEVETVQCFQDNSIVKQKLENESCRGMIPKVLVVDGGGDVKFALLGGNVATAAFQNKWVGVIINGCIRDSSEVNATEVGIRALGTSPRRSHRSGQGLQKNQVEFWGATFKQGDWISADEDGIVLIPRNLIAEDSAN